MTIKKLKEMIANMPDDARIFADNGSRLFENNSEFVCIVSQAGHPDKVVFQSTADIDTKEELRAMGEAAIDEGWSDADYYAEALERGFAPEHFADPQHARQQMQSYGLI